MIIRKASKNEIVAIATLAKGLDEYYKKEVKIFDKWDMPGLQKYVAHIENLIKNDYIILIAIENDEIVGYIAGKTFTYDYDGKLHGKIEELFVNEKYRNKGIGTKLEDDIENNFKEKGAVGVFASVYTKNDMSLKFHENRGFRAIEEYIDLHKDLN